MIAFHCVCSWVDRILIVGYEFFHTFTSRIYCCSCDCVHFTFLWFSSFGKSCLTLGIYRFWISCVAGILLFLQFDSSVSGYCLEFLIERMGLQELGITFHLGLNGVSSPLFAMAGIVGLGAGLAAVNSGALSVCVFT